MYVRTANNNAGREECRLGCAHKLNEVWNDHTVVVVVVVVVVVMYFFAAVVALCQNMLTSLA